jgi:hypothetical protein
MMATLAPGFSPSNGVKWGGERPFDMLALPPSPLIGWSLRLGTGERVQDA